MKPRRWGFNVEDAGTTLILEILLHQTRIRCGSLYLYIAHCLEIKTMTPLTVFLDRHYPSALNFSSRLSSATLKYMKLFV